MRILGFAIGDWKKTHPAVHGMYRKDRWAAATNVDSHGKSIDDTELYAMRPSCCFLTHESYYVLPQHFSRNSSLRMHALVLLQRRSIQPNKFLILEQAIGLLLPRCLLFPVVVRHFESRLPEAALDVEALVRFAAVEDRLVAADFLGDVVERLDEAQAKFLALLVFGHRDVLNVSYQTQAVNAMIGNMMLANGWR